MEWEGERRGQERGRGQKREGWMVLVQRAPSRSAESGPIFSRSTRSFARRARTAALIADNSDDKQTSAVTIDAASTRTRTDS